MQRITRRDFLHDSAYLAALAGAGAAGEVLGAGKKSRKSRPSEEAGGGERLRVAVVGVRGRGMTHVGAFANRHGCVITTICDVDEAVIGPAMQAVARAQGRAPRYERDVRRVVEDRSIDIISIATPNHWHALAALWAMQNGKDVYVEKPVSHNVSEGRRLVEAARKYQRICEAGTQSRSSSGMRQAIAFLRSGKLGTVRLARGLCYKLRGPIGKVDGPQPIPATVDYDLWCGPAPKKPLMREHLHYDWHWFWDYGNGDLGNQGVHEMDKARWGLGKEELPRSVQSVGGRFGYIDDGQTPNTQVCVYDYGDCELIFEVRGLPSKSPFPGKASPKKGKLPANFVGNVWYGSEGFLVCPSYTAGIAYSNDGKVIQRFSGPDDHFGNFIQAVHSRRLEDLNCDILEGHLSAALCHLGNISYRLGTLQPFRKQARAFGDDKEAAETLARMEEHLKDNRLKVHELNYQVGRKLRFDPKGETFLGDQEADALLTRPYRKGFEVPARV
jgi:predicted dehydrogenase